MANGKIIYLPRLTRGITLDGAHYLSLADASLNLGTGDFGLDALLRIAADTPDNLITICGKRPAAWANNAGYWFGIEKDHKRLRLDLNDGNAGGAVTVVSADDAVNFASPWPWAAVAADRNGQARFLVNGADVGGGAISTRPGSLNNTELFKVGGFDASTDRLKGAIDFLRLDAGRVLPAAWHAAEFERLRYGHKRPEVAAQMDFTEFWDFESDLLGVAAAARTLIYNGGGAPAYENGWPYVDGAITGLLTVNFEWEYTRGVRETDDVDYALNGALRRYLGAKKRTRTLSFRFNAQAAAVVEGARDSGNEVDFFEDADLPKDFTGIITKMPDLKMTFPGPDFEVEVQES